MEPAHVEAMQRRRLRAEEYKRELDAQVEEQRQRRERERVELLAAEQAEEQRVIRERKIMQQKAHLEAQRIRQKEEQSSQKIEEPVTSKGVKQNCRHGHSMSPFLEPTKAEMMLKKQLRDEEYKRDLLAQIEEQRQRRERERVEWLAVEQVEQQRVTWERRVPQQNSLLEAYSGRQEEVLSQRIEEPRATTWGRQSRRHPHSLSSLTDPSQIEIMQQKQLREEEYKRDLDAQMEEQRQRREREKAERLAEEQKLLREILQPKAPLETQSKKQKEEQISQRTEEPRTTSGVKQNSKYAHNLSCLLDPAQVEINQRQRVKNGDHKRDLDAQVEELKQRREREKAERLAAEQAEEERVTRERKIMQQEAQLEAQRVRQKEEMHLQKVRGPEWNPSEEAWRDKNQQKMQKVSRNGHSSSRPSHYVDKKPASPQEHNNWEVLTYPAGNLARLDAIAPKAVAVRIVYTKDVAVQTDPVVGLWEIAPVKDHAENRPPSPPVPALQRQLRELESQQFARRPSQVSAEGYETSPPPACGPPAQEVYLHAQPCGLPCSRPSPPPVCDGPLHAPGHVRQTIQEGLSQLHQDLQQKQRELEMAL